MSDSLLNKLTLNSVNMAPIGGQPDITWQDVAGSLSKCNEKEFLFVQAYYCGNIGSLAKFLQLMIKSSGSYKPLVAAAVVEYMDPKAFCDGKVVKEYTTNRRANLIGKNRYFYRARKTEYNNILLDIADIHRKVRKMVFENTK